MKVAQLLELHHKSPGLAQNIGDGYLLTNNKIYANIRKHATEAGFRFSADPNSLYQALPFAQLENILNTKVIPFADNVTALGALAKQLPHVAWNEISEGLKKNYIFHESCHVVARSVSNQFLKDTIDHKTLQTQRAKALKILLEESFANTCELLAVADAQETAHKIFFAHNSYTALFENRSGLKTAMDDIGPATVFQFMLLAYLHSNFLHNGLDEKQFQNILNFANAKKDLDASKTKALRALSKIAFTLDENFKRTTTPMHLRLSGITTDINELLDFDMIEVLRDGNYKEFLNSAAAFALNAVSGRQDN